MSDIFSQLKNLFKFGNRTQNKTFFEDRLVLFDEKILEEMKKMEEFIPIHREIIPGKTTFKIIPLSLKPDDIQSIEVKLNRWKSLRELRGLESDHFISGIQLLIKYGVWLDNINIFLDEFMSNEIVLYAENQELVLTSLLESSFRSVNHYPSSELYESDEVFDFEGYFNDCLQLNMKVAGFLDLSLKQFVKPYDEKLLEYRFEFEFGNQRWWFIIQSDTDLFHYILNVMNFMLLEYQSPMRFFYHVQGCKFPILLEKDLALSLMKDHYMMVFGR